MPTTRPLSVTFRLSVDEWVAVKAAAEARDVRPSAWLRGLVFAELAREQGGSFVEAPRAARSVVSERAGVEARKQAWLARQK